MARKHHHDGDHNYYYMHPLGPNGLAKAIAVTEQKLATKIDKRRPPGTR